MVRQGFCGTFAQTAISVIGDAPDGVTVVAEIRRLRPDVVLMDADAADGTALQTCSVCSITCRRC